MFGGRNKPQNHYLPVLLACKTLFFVWRHPQAERCTLISRCMMGGEESFADQSETGALSLPGSSKSQQKIAGKSALAKQLLEPRREYCTKYYYYSI